MLLVNADYVLVDNETHTLLILQDITVQKMQQEEIAFLAYHDPLTRLPNRRYFHEQLDAAHARRNGETLALLLNAWRGKSGSGLPNASPASSG